MDHSQLKDFQDTYTKKIWDTLKNQSNMYNIMCNGDIHAGNLKMNSKGITFKEPTKLERAVNRLVEVANLENYG